MGIEVICDKHKSCIILPSVLAGSSDEGEALIYSHDVHTYVLVTLQECAVNLIVMYVYAHVHNMCRLWRKAQCAYYIHVDMSCLNSPHCST